MPIYEYRCEKCKKRYEKIQKVGDPPCKKCPSCGGPLKKLVSSPAIQFKGNGFYINDYPKKSAPDGEQSAKKDGRPKTKPGKAGPESKTETKAEPMPSDKPCPD